MTDQDYKFKYLKYKQKYLDLQNKIGGNPVMFVAADRQKRAAAARQREAKEKFNVLPEEERDRILKPDIDEYNGLHDKIAKSKCGFLDCRNINSNYSKMSKFYKK